MKSFKSLQFTLTLWYTVILGVIIFMSGTYLYLTFRTGRLQAQDEILKRIAMDLRNEWLRSRTLTWEEAILRINEKYKTREPRILVLEMADPGRADANVAPLQHTPDPMIKDSYLLPRELYERAKRGEHEENHFHTWKFSREPDSFQRIYLLPVQRNYLIQIDISMAPLLDELRQLLLIMIFSGILLLSLASLGGNFFIRRALTPVRSVVKTAQNISTDDLSHRIPANGRDDEIGQLVATFNGMIARLEGSVQKIKQFSGDVSHELRTPLTVIRGEIEIALRKDRQKTDYLDTLKSIQEEILRMEKIIEDLMFLSRMEEFPQMALQEKVMLDELVLQVFEGREYSAHAKKIQYTLTSMETAAIFGESLLLERLAGNLIDNAIRYTPEGGRVEISLSKETDGIRFTVRDTGIGIPSESIPFIFDRFYVVDKSRSRETGGAGLGLSIVNHVALIHNATINVQSTPGKGSEFIICFPQINPI